MEKSEEISTSLSRAQGSSCSLDVLFGGIGISKLHFLIKGIPVVNLFSVVNFTILLSQPWIWICIERKCWIQILTNADPKPV
jgi:hypothetical protein